jgi:hypothetical protein
LKDHIFEYAAVQQVAFHPADSRIHIPVIHINHRT